MPEINSTLKRSDLSVFTTYDLGAASALICVGFELQAIEKDNPKKCRFVFQKTTGLYGSLTRYWANSLNGDLLKYFDTLKMLKNRIYSE